MAAADPRSIDALIYFSKIGNLEHVNALLNTGTSPNATNSKGETALNEALHNNNTDIAKELIKRGADINKKGSFGYTPLMKASIKGNEIMVKDLLRRGAEVNASKNSGTTALALVSQYSDRLNILKLLIAAGADVNVEDNYETTPLIYACGCSSGGISNPEYVKLLIKSGADVNKYLNYGYDGSALQCVAWRGDFEIFKILIDAGAEVTPIVEEILEIESGESRDDPYKTEQYNNIYKYISEEAKKRREKILNEKRTHAATKLIEGAIQPDMSGYKHGRLAHKAMLQAKYPGLSYYDAINAEIVKLQEQTDPDIEKITYLQGLVERFDKTGAWKKGPTAFDPFAYPKGAEEPKTSADKKSSTTINTEDLEQQLKTVDGLLQETQDKITALQIEGQTKSDIDNTAQISLEVEKRTNLIKQKKEIKKKLHTAPMDLGFGAAASGAGVGGRKKRRTRKHRGKKRKQTKRRKPRKSTRKPKRRVKKRKQTKRRRRR